MDGGRIFLLILATVFTLMWIVLAKKYERAYQPIIQSIDPEKYKYPELFCVGFALMKILKIDSKSKKARKRVKEISEVQGRQYAEYYFYVINAEKWTYGFTVLVLFALFAALANEGIALLIGAVIALRPDEEPRLLLSGSRIRMGDEEFEFRVSR